MCGEIVTCSKCGLEKGVEDFSIRSDTGKRRGQCIRCRATYIKEYGEKHASANREKRKKRRQDNIDLYLIREKESRKKNAEQRREYNKRYLKENVVARLEYQRKYREENKEEIKRKSKEKYEKNKLKNRETARERYKNNHQQVRETKKAYHQKRMREDVVYRLRHNTRGRLSRLINKVIGEEPASTLDFVGCEMGELKAHLEFLFLGGMSWDNYGSQGWHVDHIIPLSAFNLDDPEQVFLACHYTNLQPLWAHENLSKGAKLDWSRENGDN